MDDLVRLEREVQTICEQTLRPLAERLAFELPLTGSQTAGTPTVLFLGNHSSGKSSFINHLLRAELQKTGLAPTDDGFTILTHGDKEDELDGQTVVTHPGFSYQRLQPLGPVFLGRLRLKTHPAELLKTVTLIDSPGMIDSAGTTRGRGYDFSAGVRAFAEMADLILFFFDPDKPGTTGEAVSIFTETLVGLEHKLLIVMNKVDRFSNIRDFARTYGTLCWNLSKTIPTKDVPHIFNTYLPDPARPVATTREQTIALEDFDVSREEVIAEIQRTPARRADNLVSDLLASARCLSMQGRVVQSMTRRFQSIRLKVWSVTIALAVLTLAFAWLARSAESWTTPAGIALTGILLAAAALLAGHYYLRRQQARSCTDEGLDAWFQTSYRRDLALQDRADLLALWQKVRARLRKSIEALGVNGLPAGFTFRRQLRRMDAVIWNDVPKLRRQLAGRIHSGGKPRMNANEGGPLATEG
jgi:hypothetical protein